MAIGSQLAAIGRMAVVSAAGFTITEPWRLFFETLTGQLQTNSTALASVLGVNVDTLANAPTDLGADDEGYLFAVSDYGHLVRWTGSKWEWGPGDPGNGYFQDFAITPTQNGWALCDGSSVAYLVVGSATLSTSNLILPNLSGSSNTPAYRKSAASYTGSIVAASAPGLSGSTADATATVSGDTANESSHTHGFTTGAASDSENASQSAPDVSLATGAHTHTGTTNAGSAHKHGAGTLAVDNHKHAKGTLAVDATGDPAHLNVKVYFRR